MFLKKLFFFSDPAQQSIVNWRTSHKLWGNNAEGQVRL